MDNTKKTIELMEEWCRKGTKLTLRDSEGNIYECTLRDSEDGRVLIYYKPIEITE